MNVPVEEIRRVMAEAEAIFTSEEVSSALDRMALAITKRLSDANPLVLSVMHGGLITAGRLLPRLPFPLESGYLHATRYGHETFGGLLDWKVRPTEKLSGRTLLLVDDILDEGRTLAAIKEYCLNDGAADVFTAVLVDKQHERKFNPGMKADFTGLVSPDLFLFGCGMDYKGYWRNAAGIYAVKGL